MENFVLPLNRMLEISMHKENNLGSVWQKR